MRSARNDALDALDDALIAVRRALTRPGYVRRFMAALGEQVELGTYRTVRAVSRLDGPHRSVGCVADLLAIDASTASRLVDRAVAAGYVAREPAPEDRRRMRLELTPRGESLLVRATAARRELLGDVTADWSTEELVEIGGALQRLRKSMDELEQ